MKEKIIKFERGPYPKKYTAHIKNKNTNSVRKVHFGDQNYQQFKNRTTLKLYKRKNHGTKKRMERYYMRHSGNKTRRNGIDKEKRKGYFTPKLLSHLYLW